MTDITKCEGTNCPLKETCFRFLAQSNEFRQSFFSTIPYDAQNKKCVEYWTTPFCKLTKSNNNN